MIYEHIIKGTFLSRPNRFIAHVRINENETVICHVKNTGRCRELLIPGAAVLLQFHPDAAALGRKTLYSLIGVWKERPEGPLLINMDSQAPNQVAWEWLQSIRNNPPLPFYPDSRKECFPESGLPGMPPPASLISLTGIRREVTYDQSRFDLAFQIVMQGNCCALPAFMEVKGVTLEEQGLAMFPDAPTERGVKHIMELIRACREGYESYILFVIQMKKMTAFAPNWKMHPQFGDALKLAEETGVHILAYDCKVTENSLTLDQPIPVSLS